VSVRYVCDVCGAEIRAGARGSVVADLLPGSVRPQSPITVIDFCPSCRPLVAQAVQRLAERQPEARAIPQPTSEQTVWLDQPPPGDAARLRLAALPVRALTYVSITIAAFLVATWLIER
jgi:hypothetical protein